MNFCHCALVTSVSSIQNPFTETGWTGWASSNIGSLDPLSKVPPAIHTIPAVEEGVDGAEGNAATIADLSALDADGGSQRSGGLPSPAIAAPIIGSKASPTSPLLYRRFTALTA